MYAIRSYYDLRGGHGVGIARADVAEGDAAAVDQADGVAHVAVTLQDLIEKDVGAVEEGEVFTDQELTPASAHGTVELPDVDAGLGEVFVAVVDGHPE